MYNFLFLSITIKNCKFAVIITTIVVTSLGITMVDGQTTFNKLTEGTVVNTPSDHRSVNFADFNQDGFEDLLITRGNSSGAPDLIYLNKGNLTFELQPEWTNQVSDPSVGATIADINNDGHADMFVASWYNKNNVLYIGKEKDGFNIIPIQPISYSESATWGDFDKDGYLDLYVCNSGNSASDNFNFLYKNNQGTLVRQSNHTITRESNFSRSATWIDYDNDGDIDLFICNENQTKNDLFQNEGNGNFKKIMSAGDLLLESSGSMSSSWADVNQDGWIDVFICNSGFYTGQTNRLYINNGDGSFTKRTGIYESDGGCSFSSSFADYDNDGDLDLVVTNGFCNGVINNYLYLNDGNGYFVKDLTSIPSLPTPCSFGAAWGDLNNDGFLDLVIANCKNSSQAPMAKNEIWINNRNENHWIKIILQGTQSNAQGIGAKVYLSGVSNGKRIKQMREITSVSGYCSQNSNQVHFGLKDSEIIDTIHVVWPSGIQQILTNVNINQTFTIVESMINFVTDEKPIIQFDISPNPATSTISISARFDSNVDTMHLEIISSSGQTVYGSKFTNISEEWTKNLDLNELNIGPGKYHIKILSSKWSICKTLVIVR